MPLQIRQRSRQTEVYLPVEPVSPVAGTRYRLSVESSRDLTTWALPIELPASDDPSAPLKLTSGAAPAGFYRLEKQLPPHDNTGYLY